MAISHFTKNVVIDSDTMQLGSFSRPEEKNDEMEDGYDELSYMEGKGKGKSSGACWNCGGGGHSAADCPCPPKKGGEKGSPKGSGKDQRADDGDVAEATTNEIALKAKEREKGNNGKGLSSFGES